MNKAIIALFLLFSTLKSSSQNIDIPDSNFKRMLLTYQPLIDLNNDKEIQKEEAEKITDLDVSGKKITSLYGLENFVNLKTLDCSKNKITELKIANLPKLRYLRCPDNQLSLLAISNSSLRTLDCSENKLKSLIVPASVVRLECQENEIETLFFPELSNVEVIHCGRNKITTLPVERLAFLTSLDCSYNKISSFYFIGGALQDLDCGFNQLAELDVNHLSDLRSVACAGNSIQTLVIGNLRKLERITCNSNKIKRLSLFNLPRLSMIEASGNNINSLILKSELPGIISINVHGNNELRFICAEEGDKISFTTSFKVPIKKDCETNLPQDLREVSVGELNGTDKCAVDQFLRIAHAFKYLPDSIKNVSKVDLRKNKNYYAIGLDLTKGLSPEIKNSRTSYIFFKIKKKDNTPGIDCKDDNWKLLRREYVSKKSEVNVIDIFDFAEINFDETRYFPETKELALVKKAGKWGMINIVGEKIIDTKYDTITLTSSDLHVKQNGKWGIMDEKGNMLAPVKYDKIADGFPRVNDTRFLAVGIGGKYGFLNREYKEVVPVIYDDVNIISFRYPTGERNGKTVLLDEITGEEKTPLKYDFIEYFFDWLKVGIKETRTLGLINGDGKEVVKPIYEKLFMGNQNVLVYKRAAKYGLLDHQGNEITKPVFDDIDGDFKNGKSKATFQGKDVFINDKGEIEK